MNILSLFDGMSCGRIALDRADIPVEKYYASEIDKHAVTVSKANYPDIVQLGSVTEWREWGIDWFSIDLLIGGSPCQGFSFAGKQLAFDDPRSALFFVYVDILDHLRLCNPKVKFLLENVKMRKDHLQVITDVLGVEPVFINSALVSAQNRQRYYWANWEFGQPEDRGILLKDILEENIASEFYYGEKSIAYMERGNDKWQQAGARRADRYEQTENTEKAFTLTANFHKGVPYNYFRCGAMIGRKINEQGKRDDYNADIKTEQRIEIRSDQKTNCLTSVQKDNYIVDTLARNYRKLTPIECERLQTVPDNYTAHVSNTQRYRMLGNGWTVEVIAHIFGGLQHEI